MNIKSQLVNSTARTNSGVNARRYITVHETANTNRGADAQAHANLQSNGNVRQASWHIQVDDKQAIRSFRDTVRCWHGGTTTANNESLSLEICVNSDGDYDKALANAAEVVKQWRAEHGIPASRVVQHHKWTGKNCPTNLRASGKWSEFVASTDPNGSTSAPPTGGSSSSSSGKSVATLAREVIDGKHGTGDARKRALGSQYSAVQAEVNRRLGASASGSSGSRKTNAQLAREVIDGKHGTGDARKRALGSRYNAVQAEVNRILGAGGSGSSGGGGSRKSAQQVAQDIANGRGGWGNDPGRSQKLRAAGYNAADVQRRVNSILSGSSSGGSRKSVAQLAREVIDGKWGNEPTRSQRLRSAGHNAAAVQREVNRRLS